MEPTSSQGMTEKNDVRDTTIPTTAADTIKAKTRVPRSRHTSPKLKRKQKTLSHDEDDDHVVRDESNLLEVKKTRPLSRAKDERALHGSARKASVPKHADRAPQMTARSRQGLQKGEALSNEVRHTKNEVESNMKMRTDKGSYMHVNPADQDSDSFCLSSSLSSSIASASSTQYQAEIINRNMSKHESRSAKPYVEGPPARREVKTDALSFERRDMGGGGGGGGRGLGRAQGASDVNEERETVNDISSIQESYFSDKHHRMDVQQGNEKNDSYPTNKSNNNNNSNFNYNDNCDENRDVHREEYLIPLEINNDTEEVFDDKVIKFNNFCLF